MGGDDDVTQTVVLPQPVDDLDAFELTIENRSVQAIVLANGAPGSFILQTFTGTERSLEEEIQDGADTIFTYRTDVVTRPTGVFRIPGFSG